MQLIGIVIYGCRPSELVNHSNLSLTIGNILPRITPQKGDVTTLSLRVNFLRAVLIHRKGPWLCSGNEIEKSKKIERDTAYLVIQLADACKRTFPNSIIKFESPRPAFVDGDLAGVRGM